jgi:hypothetical protein
VSLSIVRSSVLDCKSRGMRATVAGASLYDMKEEIEVPPPPSARAAFKAWPASPRHAGEAGNHECVARIQLSCALASILLPSLKRVPRDGQCSCGRVGPPSLPSLCRKAKMVRVT